MISRRNFIKSSSLGSLALMGLTMPDAFLLSAPAAKSQLYLRSNELLQTWGSKLRQLQVTDATRTTEYGGILCPTYNIVHGRVGDTILPFFHLAHKNNDSSYIDAAMLLYRWMEKTVSQEDGSWLNEPVKNSWKGTTIFTIIALTEALRNYSALMEPAFRNELTNRLKKAGEFVYTTFNIDYGNINYPISASYGLYLLGDTLDVRKFKTKGTELAHQAMKFITPKDKLLFGEGDPYYEPSKKGCFSVDLGYNVEESLPALTAYGLLTKDEEVLQKVTASLQAHMEFMLPDGGWDNSWGTRNYKWTYWGSRTSDGCQPAYALLADRDPRFYKVALLNTQLWKQCTKDGLLYGGPHYISHQVPPSVHHTFVHIKALVAIADLDLTDKADSSAVQLPREKVYDTRFFSDIQTYLVSKGKYRATVTAYDREYKKTKSGHATGGALTMLWHEKAGILLCASMNDYQLFEAGNMQPDNDPLSMPLTPRLELMIDGIAYRNINDLNAQMRVAHDHQKTIIETKSRLVDKDQNNPPQEEVRCSVNYIFSDNVVNIHFSYDGESYSDQVRTVVPLISPSTDILSATNQKITLQKESAKVYLSSSVKMIQLPTTGGRIFNFVPGLEAIPVQLEGNDIEVEIEIN
ncbi:MAG TPA: hypothetical protein VIN08_26055 [Ohtaekwangia sp.]|uniref:hypothetical protein n=1 Tax=Ohtaekwangia sp. TaxID=2066019 RepID=UPI002F93EC56